MVKRRSARTQNGHTGGNTREIWKWPGSITDHIFIVSYNCVVYINMHVLIYINF